MLLIPTRLPLRHLHAFSLLLLWLGLAPLALAASPVSSEVRAKATKPGIDAVLIMDSSGSMKKTDPRRLRVPAARMFLSLLDDKDRVGLMSFSDDGYPLIRLTAASGVNRQQLFDAAGQVSSRGAFTNLHAALEKGRDLLLAEADPEKRRLLVLMSDGKMDVGDAERDEALVKLIGSDLLADLMAQGIEVHSIAFTKGSDLPLMEKIARDTGGLFRLAQTDRDLHEVFSTIFETAKSPDMLPIEGDEFQVDSSIEEVTIVAPKKDAKVQIFLQAPDGSRFSVKDEGPKLGWFVSERFDMITIRQPAAGSWKILFSEGGNKAYVVTNVGLQNNDIATSIKPGEEQFIEAWLHRNGQVLTAEALLVNTEFYMEVEQPDGMRSRFSLFDNGEFGDRVINDGIYSDRVPFDKEGAYKIRIIARSETFQREKTAYFNISPQTAATAVPATADSTPVVEETAGETPVAETPAEAEADAVAKPADSSKQTMVIAVSLFLVFNVLAVLGIVGFLWWRRRKAHKAAEVLNEVEEEAA